MRFTYVKKIGTEQMWNKTLGRKNTIMCHFGNCIQKKCFFPPSNQGILQKEEDISGNAL